MFFVYIWRTAITALCTLVQRPILSGVSGSHKTRAIPGFTSNYGIDRLVWFEARETLGAALTPERQIKEWQRDWKIYLIERDNPQWIDLYPSLSL
jgi:predicted GIY-YIG superfamily endonuclease